MRAPSLLALLSLLGTAAIAAGCSDTATVYNRPATGLYAAAHSPSPCAPPPAAPCEPAPPCATPPPCAAPPPCAPTPPPCGLPCERGQSDWHVRVLGGVPFMVGTDAGEGCYYLGADIGTTRCNCIGFDAFYRMMNCDDERVSPAGPRTSPTGRRAIPARFDRDEFGKDGGLIQFVGLKATYEKSFGGSNLYGWVGAGPEYFWTNKYIDNDSGFGGFAEAGVGWRLGSWGAVRLGVDIHGDNTSVTRKAVAHSGDSRFLWTIAPTIGMEFDF